MATDFRAVSIRTKSDACAVVKALEGQRFLGREAPMLPLPDCDSPNCRCTYEHHDDRRVGPRRNSEIGLPSAGLPGDDDRRITRGRRVTDSPNWGAQDGEEIPR